MTKSATACACGGVLVMFKVKVFWIRQVLRQNPFPRANTVAEPLVPSVPPLPFDVPAELSKLITTSAGEAPQPNQPHIGCIDVHNFSICTGRDVEWCRRVEGKALTAA